MKTKQLLLGITAINFVAIGALMYSRRPPQSMSDDPTRVQAAANPAADAFELPARPVFETTTEASSAVQSDVADLRRLAFDIAEATCGELQENPGALCLLGKLHLRSGDLSGARILWERSLQLDDKFVEPYVDLGHLEEKQGNFDKSQAFFERAIELDPKTLSAYEPLIDVLQRQAKFPEAAGRLGDLLKYDPSSVNAWCSLGRTYQQMGEFEKSKQSYLRALQLQADSHAAAVGLMTAYRSSGDKANADATAQLVGQIAASQPRVGSDRDVVKRDREKMQSLLEFTAQTSAQLLIRSGKVQEAIEQLSTTIERVPDSLPLRMELVEIYVTLGGLDQAIRVLREGVDLNPTNPVAWMELGTLCLKNRRLDAAEDALRRVTELVPGSDRAYALLAQTQMPAGRNQQAAIENARRAVEISPDAGNHYILATAFYNSGDIENTKAELKIAISLAPENAEYTDALRRIE